MWQPLGKKLDSYNFLGKFVPEEVLIDFDGPRVFTTRDADNELLLMYQAEEDESVMRYIAIPFSTFMLKKMKEGELPVREALTQSRSWLVDLKYNWAVSDVWRVEIQEMPSDYLPNSSHMIYSHLEPILSIRATGDKISKASIHASVMKGVIDSAEKCLKTLASYTLENVKKFGRPAGSLRRYYDFPAQFAYGSFEISFKRPAKEDSLFDTDSEVLGRISLLLKRGLEWATSEKPTSHLGEDDMEKRTILEAIKFLSPSTSNDVKEIQVGGKLAGYRNKPVMLTSDTRSKINLCIKQLDTGEQDDELYSFKGIIRELDKDEFTCIMREIEWDDKNAAYKADELPFTYNLEDRDTVNDAFTDNALVEVLALKKATSKTLSIIRLDRLRPVKQD